MSTIDPLPDTEPNPPQAEGIGRNYIILARDDANTYRHVANIVADNADNAIRQHAEQTSEGNQFVVIPVRNWTERNVTRETRTHIKLT